MNRLLPIARLLPTAALVAGAANLAGGTATADVTLLLGPPGGPGSVEIHDETGVLDVRRPAALQGVVLLPLDVVGRTRLTTLDPTRARLRTDVAGAGRLELPGGGGSLYRYRRDDAAGGASAFGFFRIDDNGTAVPLWERTGAGPLGQDDPFQPKLAVDTTGTLALVATTVAAGGDVIELDLATGVAVDRTAALGPRDVQLNGLGLGLGFGVVVTSGDVLRFDLAPGAQAAPVTIPGGTPPYLQGDVALSADRSCAAFAGGAGASAAHVFCVGAVGDAVQVSETPRALLGGGFLPEATDGPHLALSVDGSVAIWSSTEPLARETFTKPVPLAGQAAEQVTRDGLFVDTLDTSGEILPYRGDAFLMLVGERDLVTGGVENADVYDVVVDMATGVATVTNLSRTSGDTATPFGAGGEIGDENGILLLPGTSTLLVLADDGGSGGTNTLLAVDAVAGTTLPLLTSVRSMPVTELVAGRLALGVTRRVGNDSTELFSFPADLSGPPQLLAQAGLELTLDRAVTHASGQLAVVAGIAPDEYLVRADLVAGSAGLIAPFPLPFGAGLDFTGAGDTALSVGTPGAAMGHGTWSPLGAVQLLPAGIRSGQVLPR